MKTNKKEIVIGIVIIVLIATIGITYGLSKSGSKANEPKKTEKTARRDDKKKAPKEEIKKEAEVKQEEEVKSTDKTESSAPAIKEETVNKPSKSTAKPATGNTISKPAAKPSTNASKPATKTPRWVVDRAAWTETKQVPVYDYVYVYKVYGVKSDKSTEYIGNYYSYDEACAAMDNFDRSKYVTTGYASNLEEKLIRTDTQTINHPEEGHWEY